MKYKETLEKIARVNAMDYEYQAWAKEALAQPETPHEIGQRIAKTGGGISHLWSAVSQDDEIAEAERGFKEALAQPEQDQDEVDIRSRLYQRIHELECVLKDIAEYTGEGPPTTDWQGIVKLISDSARNALEDKEMKQPDYKQAYLVWQEKTEWVQETAKPHELGMHRADVLKQRIDSVAQRKPLTDKQLNIIGSRWHFNLLGAEEKAELFAFARAIEAAHGIKE